MTGSTPRRLCLIPDVPGYAGPAAFQRRLIQGLSQRGVEITFDPGAQGLDAVLVNGGTRRIGVLRRLHARGLPVLQRLNGMNWIHRFRPTGWRHALRAELANLNLRLIRRRWSTSVIYQSHFAQDWWNRRAGELAKPGWVVYNGVPLDVFSPDPQVERPADRIRLAVIEGRLGGGYEVGLDWALGLASGLHARVGLAVELQVAGSIGSDVTTPDPPTGVSLHWLGHVPPDKVPELDRSAHLLFAADLHPACPNSVLEALACGLPVVSFDTGALPELVTGDAGRLAAYGSDPWKVEPPDVDALVEAALAVLEDQPRFRAGARRRAEAGLGLERMIDGYLEALGWD